MTTGCEPFDTYVKLEAEEADRAAAKEREERFGEVTDEQLRREGGDR
jgi:hypothetical protein